MQLEDEPTWTSAEFAWPSRNEHSESLGDTVRTVPPTSFRQPLLYVVLLRTFATLTNTMNIGNLIRCDNVAKQD